MLSSVKGPVLKTGLLFGLLCACGQAGLATTFVMPGDDKMIVEARAIVRGKVLGVESQFDEHRNVIYTFITLKVQEVLKGRINSRKIVLKEMGGQVGGEIQKVYGTPEFFTGERVLVYLGTWPDGTLRVHEMLMGKFSIVSDPLTGADTVVRGSAGEGVLLLPQISDGITTNQMELSRYTEMVRDKLAVNWERARAIENNYYSNVPLLARPDYYTPANQEAGLELQYHLYNPPVRWFEPDSNQSVSFLVNPDRAPDGAAADVSAAMSAWSTVSGSSLRVSNGGNTSLCTLPATGQSVVAFNSCDGRWSGSPCQITLAMGGWRAISESRTINGVSFFRIIQGFVSFNPLSCESVHCNIQLIATHELGHALGMQHSWDPDFGGTPTAAEQAATMFYIANFDGRCAGLRQDDINGIRFVYPGATTAYQGFMDAAGCGIISGWAWDANQPNATINVDILDGSTLIATVPANLYREDIRNAGIGNGFHGFSFTTPASLKNGVSHSIRTRFGGTATDLSMSPRTISCSGVAPSYQGFHDGAGCNTISGWAWNQNDPNSPINVDLYDGSTFLATVPAIQYRPDLVAAGIGNGFHGFSLTVPSSLKNGVAHSIRVRFPGTTTDLQRTPRSITCGGAAPSYEGVFEAAGCSTMSGWAWDRNDPNSPINVAIFDGSQLIATVLAIQFRQSLVDQGKGNGFHVFIYNTPASLKNGQPHSISVRFSGSATGLTSSPRSITCP